MPFPTTEKAIFKNIHGTPWPVCSVLRLEQTKKDCKSVAAPAPKETDR
jgi:hypothetical protein